jgi:hypothetical protein
MPDHRRKGNRVAALPCAFLHLENNRGVAPAIFMVMLRCSASEAEASLHHADQSAADPHGLGMLRLRFTTAQHDNEKDALPSVFVMPTRAKPKHPYIMRIKALLIHMVEGCFASVSLRLSMTIKNRQSVPEILHTRPIAPINFSA